MAHYPASDADPRVVLGCCILAVLWTAFCMGVYEWGQRTLTKHRPREWLDDQD